MLDAPDELTLEDIFIIAESTDSSAEAQAQLQKLYDWESERRLEIGKLCFGGAIAVLTALLLSAWKGELANVPLLSAVIVLLAAVLAGAVGFHAIAGTVQLRKEYLGALHRLNLAVEIRKSGYWR